MFNEIKDIQTLMKEILDEDIMGMALKELYSIAYKQVEISDELIRRINNQKQVELDFKILLSENKMEMAEIIFAKDE